jgi:hypothetical protein
LGVVFGGGGSQRQGRKAENVGHFEAFSFPVIVVILDYAHGIYPQVAKADLSCEYDCILESRRESAEGYISLPCFEVS